MKTNLIGKKAVVVSEMTKVEIEKVSKFRPDALCIKDEDGKELFKVCWSNSSSISKFGINFAEVDASGKVFAMIECSDIAKGECVTPTEFVYEYAGIMENLKKVERQVAAIVDEVDSSLEELEGTISVEGAEVETAETDEACEYTRV